MARVVAITGASAGIGRATAERLRRRRRRGGPLGAAGRSARRVVRAIASRGGRALAVPGDVTREDDMDALVARAVEAFGRLDVMICNAGIGYHGPLDETPPAAMRRLVDVNLMGTLYAARAALRAFRRQGRGHIIIVSSIVGRRGVGGSSVYSATKAAQVGVHRIAARRVRRHAHPRVGRLPGGHGHRVPRDDRARLRLRGRAARARADRRAGRRRHRRLHRLAARRGVSASQGVVARGAQRRSRRPRPIEVVQKFARRRKPVAAAA